MVTIWVYLLLDVLGGVEILLKEVIRLLISSAENAFIQVTVFVGAVLILFGYINFKKSGKLVKKLKILKRLNLLLVLY